MTPSFCLIGPFIKSERDWRCKGRMWRRFNNAVKKMMAKTFMQQTEILNNSACWRSHREIHPRLDLNWSSPSHQSLERGYCRSSHHLCSVTQGWGTEWITWCLLILWNLYLNIFLSYRKVCRACSTHLLHNVLGDGPQFSGFLVQALVYCILHRFCCFCHLIQPIVIQ